MLDNEVSEIDEVEPDAEATEAEGVEQPEEDAFTVSLGDEDEEEASEDGEADEGSDELPEDAPPFMKRQRQKLKEASKALKENRELKERLAALEKAKQPAEPEPALGPKPTLESCDYDEDKFEAALVDWREVKAKSDAKAKAAETEAEEQRVQWQETLGGYAKSKTALSAKVKDYDEAEAAVRDTFSESKQGILLEAMGAIGVDPALMVYALSQNPDAMAKLASENNPVKFTAKLINMASKMAVKGPQSDKPKPETRLRGAAASAGVVGGINKQLEKLHAKARESGDYTEYRAAKKRMEK